MTSPSEKRHLPVLSGSKVENDAHQSPWVWVLTGSIVIVSAWVPLALIALFVGRKITSQWAASNSTLSSPSASMVLPTAALVALSFAGACALGGGVVGRFAENPRRFDAALAGTLGALFVLFFAALGHALRPPLVGVAVALSLLLIACPASALGGRWGRKRRA
jgi:hypothetical protein